MIGFVWRCLPCMAWGVGVLAVVLALPSWGYAASLPVNKTLGGAFSLPSTTVGVTGLRDFDEKVVLLNFGYTSCPDVCPMVLSRLSRLHKNLEATLGERAQKVQTAFISVDPEYDTIDRLRTYLDFFYPTMVGFSGSTADVQRVAQQYGAVFMPEPSTANGTRRVAHSDFVYLLDLDGYVRKIYDGEATVAEMQADVVSLLNEHTGFWSRLFSAF